MSCFGINKTRISLETETRIYKKENTELRTQLLSNFGSLHTLHNKLEETQNKCNMLIRNNQELEREKQDIYRMCRRIKSENRKYREELERVNQKIRKMEEEVKNIVANPDILRNNKEPMVHKSKMGNRSTESSSELSA